MQQKCLGQSSPLLFHSRTLRTRAGEVVRGTRNMCRLYSVCCRSSTGGQRARARKTACSQGMCWHPITRSWQVSTSHACMKGDWLQLAIKGMTECIAPCVMIFRLGWVLSAGYGLHVYGVVLALWMSQHMWHLYFLSSLAADLPNTSFICRGLTSARHHSHHPSVQ